MKTVYRLECPDTGEGVYQTPAAAELLDDLRQRAYGDPHPGPTYDPILSVRWEEIIEGDGLHDYFFGFSSLEQYHAWVYCPEVREKIGEHVVLSEYRAPDAAFIEGTHQCVFKWDEAKLVTRHVPSMVN